MEMHQSHQKSRQHRQLPKLLPLPRKPRRQRRSGLKWPIFLGFISNVTDTENVYLKGTFNKKN